MNVLLALAWPSHVHHRDALAWFAAKAKAGFRTCPITQTGFVRISSNPAFSSNAVSPGEASALLHQIVQLPRHEFWPDDLTLANALESLPVVVGHRQVTDAYLIALAFAHGGIFATLDRAALALAQAKHGDVEAIL